MERRRVTMAAVAAWALAAAHARVAAADYPSRPVRIVVDAPAGATVDVWARRFAERMGAALGQVMVVDNRPGATGTLAAADVLRAAPDGHTLLFGGMNALVVYPSAGGVVRYDPGADFAPVAIGPMGYPLLVAGAGSGLGSVTDLLARARSRPAGGPLVCGTSGLAGLHHFACAAFARAAGIPLDAVAYKSASQAAIDVAGDRIAVTVGFPSEVEPLVLGGRLTPLAVFGPSRLPAFANVPTMAEAGLPGIEMPSFSGFFAAAGTPAPIVERLNAEAVRAMQRPEMQEWLRSGRGFHVPMGVRQFADFCRTEREKWRRLSQETGLQVAGG